MGPKNVCILVTPYIICADLEPLIKKIDGCLNNPEISSATKVGIRK